MALQFRYTPRAEKELHALPKLDRERIERKVETYAATPDSPQHDVRALVNTSPRYRLRVGDWRVLFEIEQNTMQVRRILHRREAYR